MATRAVQIYSLEVRQQVKSALNSMAKQPKGLTLRDLIRDLKADIDSARKAGHTLEDIAKLVSDNGVPIKANTLKQYLKDDKVTGTGAVSR